MQDIVHRPAASETLVASVWLEGEGTEKLTILGDDADVGKRCRDVVAYQVEPMLASTIVGMDSEFCRCKGEDRPVDTGIDRWGAEDVSEAVPVSLGVGDGGA